MRMGPNDWPRERLDDCARPYVAADGARSVSEVAGMRKFVLVNANIVRPPVSPVGLEYMAHSLQSNGIPVEIVDLAFEPDWKASLASAVADGPLAVGIAVRNTDDCCFATGRSFLPWISEVVSEVKRLTGAPVVLGGVGFSVCPDDVMRLTGADFGICGEAEEAAVLLGRALDGRGEIGEVPNLLYAHYGQIRRNARSEVDLRVLPLPRRRILDNPRYQSEGAMVGIETKRGCPRHCIFCADPVAKGTRMRPRPPAVVVQEMEDLLAQGVSWYHLSDSEFNITLEHAKDVCRAIIAHGLGQKVRWYTYCCPFPFDQELANLMLRAGCVGINFGVDSLSDPQLERLGREHRLVHVERLVEVLKTAGTNFIFDLLLGGPGETESTVRDSIGEAQRLNIPLVGLAVGVRVYPGTRIWQLVTKGHLSVGLHGDHSTGRDPLFFVSPELGRQPTEFVAATVAGDSRFFLLSAPEAENSYNYAGDRVLAEAIRGGARGAYWDILRRMRGKGDKASGSLPV